MKPNKIIQRWREGMGWDREDTFMATRAGMSWSCYYDVEAHEDEAYQVVPLMHMRRIAEAIGIPIHELFGLEACEDVPLQSQRHVYIAEARRRGAPLSSALSRHSAAASDGPAGTVTEIKNFQVRPCERSEAIQGHRAILPHESRGSWAASLRSQ